MCYRLNELGPYNWSTAGRPTAILLVLLTPGSILSVAVEICEYWADHRDGNVVGLRLDPPREQMLLRDLHDGLGARTEDADLMGHGQQGSTGTEAPAALATRAATARPRAKCALLGRAIRGSAPIANVAGAKRSARLNCRLAA
jgi:hypothetical protein